MTAHNPDTREKLLELAARCEKATRPSRKLDAEIEVERRRQDAYAAGLNDATRAHWKADTNGQVFDTHTRYTSARYTASIDAAMTISPVTRQVDVLLDAISACQGDEDGWWRDLPRFVCAAALRAQNEQVTK